jgi:predicted helicase
LIKPEKKYNHRPFTPTYIYHSDLFIDEQGLTKDIFTTKKPTKVISLCGTTSSKDFHLLAIDNIYDLHFTGDSQGISLYRYQNSERIDNITDWGLSQFTTHYNNSNISKEDIFHYVYAILHHPAYRSKYELNLKREFPRIPFYNQFEQWAQWGKQLMELHINYETVQPYGLPVQETIYELTNAAALEKMQKAKLKANKAEGSIELDGVTSLTGIPAAAWNYKLGNRSALEWILDQYKEKKPGDPTIAEKFNTYKFADYKEQVIDLLQRVCTVSVETMKIVEAMPE